jgi:ACR3 family arsenite transporter
MSNAMATESKRLEESRGLGFFETYLYIWVILCILAGIVLGKVAPDMANYLDSLAIYVGDAPVVSIPIAICFFL